MKVKCKHCIHIWNYKGSSEYYLTCPHCYRKINVKTIEHLKEDEQPTESTTQDNIN